MNKKILHIVVDGSANKTENKPLIGAGIVGFVEYPDEKIVSQLTIEAHRTKHTGNVRQGDTESELFGLYKGITFAHDILDQEPDITDVVLYSDEQNVRDMARFILEQNFDPQKNNLATRFSEACNEISKKLSELKERVHVEIQTPGWLSKVGLAHILDDEQAAIKAHGAARLGSGTLLANGGGDKGGLKALVGQHIELIWRHEGKQDFRVEKPKCKNAKLVPIEVVPD